MTDYNHGDLIKSVATRTGLTQKVVEDVLRAAFDTIGQSVVTGDTIRVSNFGTWTSKPTPARIRRNFQTGQPVQVPAGRRPVFLWAPIIRDSVRYGVAPATFKKSGSR